MGENGIYQLEVNAGDEHPAEVEILDLGFWEADFQNQLVSG